MFNTNTFNTKNDLSSAVRRCVHNNTPLAFTFPIIHIMFSLKATKNKNYLMHTFVVNYDIP